MSVIFSPISSPICRVLRGIGLLDRARGEHLSGRGFENAPGNGRVRFRLRDLFLRVGNDHGRFLRIEGENVAHDEVVRSGAVADARAFVAADVGQKKTQEFDETLSVVGAVHDREVTRARHVVHGAERKTLRHGFVALRLSGRLFLRHAEGHESDAAAVVRRVAFVHRNVGGNLHLPAALGVLFGVEHFIALDGPVRFGRRGVEPRLMTRVHAEAFARDRHLGGSRRAGRRLNVRDRKPADLGDRLHKSRVQGFAAVGTEARGVDGLRRDARRRDGKRQDGQKRRNPDFHSGKLHDHPLRTDIT